jgi:excisionase family DNA binding protein
LAALEPGKLKAFLVSRLAHHAHDLHNLALVLPCEVAGRTDVTSQTGQSQPMEPRIGRSVSIDQAAVMLKVSRRTVYYRIREGRLQTIRTLGRSQRVLLESIAGLQPAPLSTDPSSTTPDGMPSADLA